MDLVFVLKLVKCYRMRPQHIRSLWHQSPVSCWLNQQKKHFVGLILLIVTSLLIEAFLLQFNVKFVPLKANDKD